MASWQSAFAPWTANIHFIISQNADHIQYLGGGGAGGREGSDEKEDMGVKWASHYYLYICIYIYIIITYIIIIINHYYLYIYIYLYSLFKTLSGFEPLLCTSLLD